MEPACKQCGHRTLDPCDKCEVCQREEREAPMKALKAEMLAKVENVITEFKRDFNRPWREQLLAEMRKALR